MKFFYYDRRGSAVGDSILIIYRLVLLAAIAFVVVGISSMVYSYDINVRDVEAGIMARSILYCLADEGSFDISELQGADFRYSVLDHCGFEGDLSRIFVRLTFYDSDGNVVVILEQGDSGAVWVHDLFSRNQENEKLFGSSSFGENSDVYEPGYFRENYKVHLRKASVDQLDTNARVNVEVLMNADF